MCGNLFENEIVPISLIDYNIIANDNSYNGSQSAAGKRMVYSMCNNCGCIFKRSIEYFEIHPHCCNRCLNINVKLANVSACSFTRSTKYISSKESIDLAMEFANKKFRETPIEFCADNIENTTKFFVSQWKKTKPVSDIFLSSVDRRKIMLTPIKIVNKFNPNTMRLEPMQVSSEIYKTKIYPRLSKSSYIHGNIVNQFNRDTISY